MTTTASTVLPTALALGGHPKVDDDYRQALLSSVETSPRECGQAFSTWACSDLAAYLDNKGFPAVSDETVRRHLQALGYRVIRPVLTISSPDPEYDVKEAQLRRYQEQARRGEVTMLYEDEVDLHLLPGITGCWTRRGSQRKVATPGQNQKRYGFGAVNMLTGAVTRRIEERKNSVGFCALVEQVVAEYCPGESWDGRKVVLVIDNYIIHRSKATQRVLERYADRLIICPLPTYSPKLNVIELLWKHLRRKVTHNHLFESVAALTAAVETFFSELDHQPATVLSVIGCSG
jgi:putative transposase